MVSKLKTFIPYVFDVTVLLINHVKDGFDIGFNIEIYTGLARRLNLILVFGRLKKSGF
jgi:hypothetical protein